MGGMTIVGVCMIVIAVLVELHKADPVLIFICIAVITF
jgi:hypothetical protein